MGDGLYADVRSIAAGTILRGGVPIDPGARAGRLAMLAPAQEKEASGYCIYEYFGSKIYSENLENHFRKYL
jgi:hypothetical protein